MRAKILVSIAAFALSLMIVSCSKSSQEEVVLSTRNSNEVVSATVISGTAYELPLTRFGSVTIHTQAKNYSESFTGIDSKTGLLIYKYVPAANFTGEDKVVLKTSKTVQGYSGSAGSGCGMPGSSAYTYNSQATSLITIKFKVVK